MRQNEHSGTGQTLVHLLFALTPVGGVFSR